MKLTFATIVCLVSLAAVPVFAQTKPAPTQPAGTKPAAIKPTSAETDMQILVDKVKADKKLLVAANMDLTDTEAKAFWPIYDDYQKELKALNERLTTAIKGYADAYNKNALTDAQATKLVSDTLAIDQDEVAMRKKFAMTLSTVLPGKKAARYLQIENKIRAALRSEMAEQIPLIE